MLKATCIVNPRAAMQLVFEECPILTELSLVTEGFIFVGIAAETLPFIHNLYAKFMAESLINASASSLSLGANDTVLC